MPDQSTWEYINTFAPWLAALGTFTAASVALYLGLSQRREKLLVSAAIWQLYGSPGSPEKFVRLTATNIGHCEVIVQDLGWRSGWFKKSHYVQDPGQPISIEGLASSSFPCKLQPGENCQVIMKADYFLQHVDQFFDTPLQKLFPKLHLKSFKVLASTSRDNNVIATTHPNLRGSILRTYQNIVTVRSKKSEEESPSEGDLQD